ncbi:FecCD family ABC transporter permease [Salininema proteolyticum]|uniref:FecCD family ABC transporter permease n=1 Tax=Salininema proteolyticum TaxID=1607685 RepID=A0ABV8TTS0_9ACTN
MTTLDAPRRRAVPARRLVWWTIAAAVLAALVLLSILVGSNPIPPGDLWQALLGDGGDEARYVVWQQRLPRTLAGIVVGVALGAAGALIQAFTRNPLADPGILGVNAGAAFSVAVGIAFFGVTAPIGYVWLACGGALVMTIVVYTIGGAGGASADPVRLTLAGVAFGAVLSGLTTGIALTNPDTFDRMRGWNAGSLLERGVDVVLPVLPIILAGLVLAALAAPALNSVALGRDVARSHGIDVKRMTVVIIAATTLLAGGATAIAGPIGFVGLMVPHAVRWTIGVDQRHILAGSMIAAPILVLGADILGRIAVAPSEMPAGIVTAFVGAPVLIALVRRRKASAL